MRQQQQPKKIKLQQLKDRDPFDEKEKLLKSIAIGLTVTEDKINCDDEQKRLVKKSKANWMVFLFFWASKLSDHICVLETFKLEIQITKEKVHADSLPQFLRLLVLLKKEVIKNEFKYKYKHKPVPISITIENGIKRKATKSNLAKAIKQNVFPSKPLLTNCVACLTEVQFFIK